jgi:hypothetical protein
MFTPKPTPVAQVDFNGRNLKPAPAAKLLVFPDFSFDFAFQKCFSFFYLKSMLRGTNSTTIVASKVRSTQQFKVNFGFQVAYQKSVVGG